MKKILFLLVVLIVLVVPAQADDWLDSLAEQSIFVKMTLGFSAASNAIHTDTVNWYLRDAYSILAPVVAAKEVIDSIFTVSNQIEYSLDSQIIKVEEVYWHHQDSLKMMPVISSDSLSKLYRLGYTLKGKVKFRLRSSYHQWTQGKIKLFPPPFRADDTIIIKGIGRIDNIMTDSAFVSDFPVNYRSLPVTYAAYRIAVSRNMVGKINQLWQLLLFQISALQINIDVEKFRNR